MNKMQQYKQRILASQGLNTTTNDKSAQVNNVLDLNADLADLKAIVSVKEKIEHKRNVLLPKYLPKAKSILQNHELLTSNKPLPLLVYCMIWSFDTGDIEQGFEFYQAVLRSNQDMPENIRSNPTVFAFGAFYDWAKEQHANGRSAEPYLTNVYQHIDEQDIKLPDELMANIHKLVGDYHFDSKEFDLASSAFEQASLLLGEKAKVKTRLAKVRKELEQLEVDKDDSTKEHVE